MAWSSAYRRCGDWDGSSWVAKQPGTIDRYQRKYVAVVARCTDQGRQVLQLLGEE
jgi:hypothetical protein